MTIFIIIAAALVLLAIVILTPALLRSHQLAAKDRNQQNVVIAQERLSELEADRDNGALTAEQFEQAKRELEQALLLDLGESTDTPNEASRTPGRIALAALLIAVPLVSSLLYLYLGDPGMVTFDRAKMAAAQAEGHDGKKLPPIDKMVDSLVNHLKEQPDDEQGWFLLGRTHMMLKDYPKAVDAFDHALKLSGDVPAVMLSLADAIAMTKQGDMSGRPSKLVRKAVKLAPDDATALWLAGMVEQQSGNFTLSLEHFKALRPLLTNEPESLQRVDGFIANLQERLGMSAEEIAASNTGMQQATAVASSGPSIKVSVSLSPEILSQASPDQSVFVYAKALQGPPMPLAAARYKVKDLPIEVVLDDNSAMLPQMKLSNFPKVKVGARISSSGNPIAQPGDLNGEISPVTVEADAAVEVVIDSVVK